MKCFPIRLQKEGIITVPQAIQDKLNLHEGDWLNLVEIEDLIMLTLKEPQVPKLADQITTIRETENISVNELLEGLENERQIIYQKKQNDDGEYFQILPLKSKKPRPKFGSAKGSIEMSDDFDEPLTDFENYEP